jgi:hypothetical protein
VFGRLDQQPTVNSDMRLGQELAVSYDKIETTADLRKPSNPYVEMEATGSTPNRADVGTDQRRQ